MLDRDQNLTDDFTERPPPPAHISCSGCASMIDLVNRDLRRPDHDVAEGPGAECDRLTGLLSRPAFLKDAELHVSGGSPAAILLFDLDAFADLNDVMGHTVGDRLLASVADRLRDNVRPDHLLARISGDRFALLIPGLNDPRSAYNRAQNLLDALGGEFEVGEQVLLLESSAGIAVSPHHGATVEELLMAAELSLYRAKEKGGGAAAFYEPHLRRQLEARRALQNELRRASEHQEFELLYQPQVDLRSRRIVGAEALLRWNHPVRGQIGPACFLDVLDQMPLAVKVGDWVIDTAIAQAADWASKGLQLRVGANLFGLQLRDGTLADSVASRLRHHGLPPALFELELTETVAIKDSRSVASTLETLRRIGVGVALDDFGTGFASLSMLKELPISRLKIDKSFVLDLVPGSRNAVLVDAILRMGKTFDLDVIAEGIEGIEQEEWLLAQQCSEGQGFMYGKPMPASQLTRMAARA
jgi:diguanylate cyclase (GGDEF)-like protein